MAANELDALKLVVAEFSLYVVTLNQALLNKGVLSQAEIDAAQKQVADLARAEGARILSLPKAAGAQKK